MRARQRPARWCGARRRNGAPRRRRARRPADHARITARGKQRDRGRLCFVQAYERRGRRPRRRPRRGLGSAHVRPSDEAHVEAWRWPACGPSGECEVEARESVFRRGRGTSACAPTGRAWSAPAGGRPSMRATRRASPATAGIHGQRQGLVAQVPYPRRRRSGATHNGRRGHRGGRHALQGRRCGTPLLRGLSCAPDRSRATDWTAASGMRRRRSISPRGPGWRWRAAMARSGSSPAACGGDRRAPGGD